MMNDQYVIALGDVVPAAGGGEAISSSQIILGIISALALVLAPVLTALASNRGKQVTPPAVGTVGSPAASSLTPPVVQSTVALPGALPGTPDPEYMNVPITVMVLNKVLADQALSLAKAQSTIDRQLQQISDLKAQTSMSTGQQQRLADLEASRVATDELASRVLDWGTWAPGQPPRAVPDEWRHLMRAQQPDTNLRG